MKMRILGYGNTREVTVDDRYKQKHGHSIINAIQTFCT